MKILVVEDMEWIRKGIVKMLSNLDIDIEHVLQGENGKEALVLSEKYQPALVITDIKMPGMNGLEFIKAAKKIIPNSEFIIITGYAEFEYAKQAVDLGVKGFLLKPIQNDNFKDVISKALHAIEDKEIYNRIIKEKNYLKKEQEQLNLQNKLNRVFLGKDQKRWKHLDCYHALIAIRFDCIISQVIKEELNHFAIKVDKLNILVAENYIDANELFMVLSCNNKSVLVVEKERLSLNLYREFENKGVNCYIASSSIKDSIMKEMYSEIQEAFISKLFSKDKIYSFDSEAYNQKTLFYRDKLNLLRLTMEKGELAQVKERIEDILLSMEGHITYTQMKIVLSLISNQIFEVYHLSYEEVKSYQLFSDELTANCHSMECIIDKLYTLIEKIINKKHFNVSVDLNTIEKIKEYIEAHYMDDLTARDIAQYFNISSSYLSTIFKKNTGIKLSGYITDLRIEKACELLRDSHINVSDISMAIGYQDVQYFYRVFKKCMGITPLNYRKQQMSS